MLEGAVMEYAKWFLGIMSFAFFTVAVVWMFQMNDMNSFQQEVNYQVERHGGLTEDALVELNEHAKVVYGGCLLESNEAGASCLFNESDDVTSSGFFVKEFVKDGEQLQYYERASDDQARYGTVINYALVRQIGNMNGRPFLEPAVIGESASRVRGTAN